MLSHDATLQTSGLKENTASLNVILYVMLVYVYLLVASKKKKKANIVQFYFILFTRL